MSLFLYNTLSRKKEEFKPLTSGVVSMYHCGPTVYWTQHIGNMRAVFFADIVRRVFEYNNYTVKLVRNYTDVGHLTGDNIGDADSGEDRMEKAAKREGLSPEAIAAKYIEIYNKDISLLGTLPPTHCPKATEHIGDMIAMTQILLEKGFAYTTPLAIYFDTSKLTDYTKLSHQKLEEQKAGAGSGDVSDSAKKNPTDFALWFFKAGVHQNILQYWPSPFSSPLVSHGEGFPGWHIECSAMSKHFLGPTFDIHMGGIEHIPVHHTNEIAQSEACNDAPYVKYWLHNEHLLVDGGKMSKSEGTSFSISDIEEKGYSPLHLRYFFLQAHYRSKQNFTWEALTASQSAYTRLIQTVISLLEDDTEIKNSPDETFVQKFNSFLSDDFNTAGALSLVSDLIKNKELRKDIILATLANFDTVLGLRIIETALSQKAATDAFYKKEEVVSLMQKMQEARDAKNWQESDSLRAALEALKKEAGL
jgi:cysteinyl-tRNA synthetase